MCDTSVQDNQIIRVTEQINQLTSEKNTLLAVRNPNAEILNTINIIDGKIQRLNLRLSNINQTKAQIIANYNATCNCHANVVGFGAEVSRIYSEHNPM